MSRFPGFFPGTGDRRHPVSTAAQAEPQAPGALQELPPPGRESEQSAVHPREGGPPHGQTVSTRHRLLRDEDEGALPLAGALLQQAGHGRAADQGRRTGDELDAAVAPALPGEPGAAATERPGAQPGNLVAAAQRHRRKKCNGILDLRRFLWYNSSQWMLLPGDRFRAYSPCDQLPLARSLVDILGLGAWAVVAEPRISTIFTTRNQMRGVPRAGQES